MLHLELGRHGEFRAFLDLERVVFEGLLGARRREVDGHGVAADGVHAKGDDDAVSRVVGVGEVFSTAAEAEGFFVALEGLIVGV